MLGLRVSKHTIAHYLRRMPFIQAVLRGFVGLFSPRYTVGVVGVVLDGKGRILLVEHVFHPTRPWGLPGGWLLASESPDEGVAREIVEETGLQVDVVKPLLIDVSRHSSRHLDIAYLCSPRGDVKFLSRELLDYEWVHPEAVPRLVDFHQAAIDALKALQPIEETLT